MNEVLSMMNNGNKKNNIAPTLTLAKLYESQNQYFNALQIYEQLESLGEPGMMQDDIQRVNEMIFKDSESIYNETTKKLFSHDDLCKFRIIPSEMFESYLRSINSESEEFEKELDEEIEEEEYVNEPEVKNEQFPDIKRNINDPIVKELAKNISDSAKSENSKSDVFKQIMVSDLSAFLLNVIKTDKPLGDLTLSEIWRIIKEMSEE